MVVRYKHTQARNSLTVSHVSIMHRPIGLPCGTVSFNTEARQRLDLPWCRLLSLEQAWVPPFHPTQWTRQVRSKAVGQLTSWERWGDFDVGDDHAAHRFGVVDEERPQKSGFSRSLDLSAGRAGSSGRHTSGFGWFRISTSALRPNTSLRRINSWRMSLHVCPVFVRNSMAVLQYEFVMSVVGLAHSPSNSLPFLGGKCHFSCESVKMSDEHLHHQFLTLVASIGVDCDHVVGETLGREVQHLGKGILGVW